MQNRTHHKTTPNSTSERPSGLTVSVTLEDAWCPKQTWGWRREVAKEQGWQVLPTWGSSVYFCYTSACNPSAVPSPPPPRSPRPLPPPLPPRAENDWIVTIVLYCYSSQHTNHTWEWAGWWFSEHLWGGHDGDYQRHLYRKYYFLCFNQIFWCDAVGVFSDRNAEKKEIFGIAVKGFLHCKSFLFSKNLRFSWDAVLVVLKNLHFYFLKTYIYD